MSPTIFREGAFEFFFFANEEPRMHVHVKHTDGDAKFWIEPAIELARNYGLSDKQLKLARNMVVGHEALIREVWNEFFKRKI